MLHNRNPILLQYQYLINNDYFDRLLNDVRKIMVLYGNRT